MSAPINLLHHKPRHGQDAKPCPPEPMSRTVGGTEYSCCKAVPGGTGITVLALLFSKQPDIPLLHTALHSLQNSHPLLRSKLRFNPNSKSFSYITSSSSYLQIQLFDTASTSKIISKNDAHSIDPHHVIVEHELNRNPWSSYIDQDSQTESEGTDMFFASLYTLSETRWVLVLRLHNSACDITSAAALSSELLGLVGGGTGKEYESEKGINLATENLVPSGKGDKPFWVRRMDMVGYSLNSFRLSNLKYLDADSPRYSQMVRLQMSPGDTQKLLHGCKSKGIKLCGALAAAGLIAAHSTKDHPDGKREKYAIVTLVDCRALLDPVLTSHHMGFYHSAILNTHEVSEGEDLWKLAKRCYMAFANAKNNNKHFTDMGDLNFLMCKAIDNPSLTPSSSLRTAFMSVFEDGVILDSDGMNGKLGVEDCMACASVHGVGPSIAIFETIRDGQLDCPCVYPSPLHSREQMQKLIDDMKRIIVGGCSNMGSDDG